MFVLFLFFANTNNSLIDVFGPEDKFVNSMGQMIRYWPAVPLLAPHKKIQPVFVRISNPHAIRPR
jgi:hypothetical protein